MTASASAQPLTMDRLDAASRQQMSSKDTTSEPVTEELDIEIVFRSRKGDQIGGTVTSVVPLLIEHESRVANVFSNLTGGVPFSSVAPATADYLWKYATLVVFIPVRPKWFMEAADSDAEFVAGIYEEVIAHCDMFRGNDGDHQEGADDPRGPRLRVTSALSRARADGTAG